MEVDWRVKRINEVQELVFKLMRKSSFGHFDGNAVVDDLERNPGLWRSVYADRSCYLTLTHIVDLEANQWCCDNIVILPVEGREDELERFVLSHAEKWHVDDVAWLSGEGEDWRVAESASGSKAKVALRVWW